MKLLADRILYKKNWGKFKDSNKVFEHINSKLLSDTARKIYSTKVVALDNATSELAYELSLSLYPRQVMENLRYFRLPADRLWFEFRRDSFLPQTPPGTTGFMLEKFGNEGFSVSLVDEEERADGNAMSASLIKFYFSLDRDDIRSLNNPLHLSFRQRTYFALGMQYEPGTDIDEILNDIQGFSKGVMPDMNNDVWHNVSEHFDFDIAVAGDSGVPEGFSKYASHYLQELAGTIRHVLAILMLYYFPPVEHYQRIPQKGRRIINGQSKPFLSFEDMKIRVPKRKPINPYKWVRKGLATTDIGKRRHEVEGHWRKVRPLTKKELDDLDRPRSQLMPHEFYKTVWVRKHERGDAALGYVRKRKHLVSE